MEFLDDENFHLIIFRFVVGNYTKFPYRKCSNSAVSREIYVRNAFYRFGIWLLQTQNWKTWPSFGANELKNLKISESFA